MNTENASTTCRSCSSTNLEVLLDLKEQPIAHRFLKSKAELQQEEQFPLSLHLCKECGLPQILEPVDPKILYSGYNFCFSSQKPQPHVSAEAYWLLESVGPKRTLELGSNDGLFLSALREVGFNDLLGVEPNPHAAEHSRMKGHRVIQDFFDAQLTERLSQDEQPFDLIVSRQVLEHIPDLQSFLGGAHQLLAPDGYLFLEVPDVSFAFKNGDISCIWEEHVNYFTEETLQTTCLQRGFEVIESRTYDFSGGSTAVLARKSTQQLPQVSSESLNAILNLAREFPRNIDSYKAKLISLLKEVKQNQFSTVVYGVGCRASAIINFLGIHSLIDFAVDDQPERQGLFMPGSGIEIRSSEALHEISEPVLCLLAVNNECEPVVTERINYLQSVDSPIYPLSVLGPKPPNLALEQLIVQLQEHYPECIKI